MNLVAKVNAGQVPRRAAEFLVLLTHQIWTLFQRDFIQFFAILIGQYQHPRIDCVR